MPRQNGTILPLLTKGSWLYCLASASKDLKERHWAECCASTYDRKPVTVSDIVQRHDQRCSNVLSQPKSGQCRAHLLCPRRSLPTYCFPRLHNTVESNKRLLFILLNYVVTRKRERERGEKRREEILVPRKFWASNANY